MALNCHVYELFYGH